MTQFGDLRLVTLEGEQGLRDDGMRRPLWAALEEGEVARALYSVSAHNWVEGVLADRALLLVEGAVRAMVTRVPFPLDVIRGPRGSKRASDCVPASESRRCGARNSTRTWFACWPAGRPPNLQTSRPSGTRRDRGCVTTDCHLSVQQSRRVRHRRLGRLVQQQAPALHPWDEDPRGVRASPLRGPQPRAAPRIGTAQSLGRFTACSKTIRTTRPFFAGSNFFGILRPS